MNMCSICMCYILIYYILICYILYTWSASKNVMAWKLHVLQCRCISFPFTCTVHALSLSYFLSLSLSLSPPFSPSLSSSLLALSLSILLSQDTCTLKSKFEFSSGPTSPTPALVHFMCDQSTLSGIAMAIENSAYKISLQKNKCFSGKVIIIVYHLCYYL